MKNNMYYILMIFYFLLFLLYPYFVPQYLSLDGFLLSWLLFVALTATMIRLIMSYLKKKKIINFIYPFYSICIKQKTIICFWFQKLFFIDLRLFTLKL
ncbi:hypothetical protein CAT7_02984 [Carnobacterium sp. AT7]|nr:hypothetical protein CAT7_02984 [Carnobacterium sp. AT7]